MASLTRLPKRTSALFSSFRYSQLPLPTLCTHSICPRQPLFPLSAPRSRTLSRSPPSQLYHSALHPRLPDHEYTNSQTAILSAALPHIPEHGFTATSLTLGARDAGFLDVSVQLLPRGEFDLILFWLASRRGLLRGQVEEGALLQRVAAERGLDVSQLDIATKTQILVMERLRMNTEIRGQWQDALAQMSLLSNIPLALAELHALSNDIVSLAGDTAADGSWYSRRMAVAAIYASAEVVMTRDPTPDLAETAAFVARRFEDRRTIAGKIEVLGQCIGLLGNTAVGVGRSWGLKV